MPPYIQRRSPFPAPNPADGATSIPRAPDQTRDVIFRHPAYGDRSNIILMLPPLDHPDAALDYNTALVACAVVANNAWHGFFTLDQAGEQRVEPPEDGLLRRTSYYFRVSDQADERYPVVFGFHNWIFPDKLPDAWTNPPLVSTTPPDRPMPRQSSLTEALLARDVSCRLTNHVEGTEHAHLVPRSEESWFNANAMFCFARANRPGISAIDVPQNALLLRRDIHAFLDQRRIVFVPKPGGLVVHVLAPGSSSELARMYHNVALQPLTGVAIEYLFARFAWAIFSYVKFYLSASTSRTLCVVEDGQLVVKTFKPEQLLPAALSRKKSRSISPQKRKTSDAQCDSEGRERGRPRRRSPVTSACTSSGGSSFTSSWLTDDVSDETEASDINYDSPVECDGTFEPASGAEAHLLNYTSG